jgi:biopolymer transport protein ExbB
VLDVIKAGGWLMLPIIACSVIALTIIVERFLSLRQQRVLPKNLVKTLRVWGKTGKIPDINLDKLAIKSPLGRIVAAGLANREHGRDIVKESIEDTGRHVVHELERFLNSLGTIAAITPLLGLLGTVVGMIDVFTVISMEGTGEAEQLAGGISQALITTAAGLSVAIPSLLFYRYFCGKVETLVVRMEEEAMRLVDILHTLSFDQTSSASLD